MTQVFATDYPSTSTLAGSPIGSPTAPSATRNADVPTLEESRGHVPTLEESHGQVPTRDHSDSVGTRVKKMWRKGAGVPLVGVNKARPRRLSEIEVFKNVTMQSLRNVEALVGRAERAVSHHRRWKPQMETYRYKANAFIKSEGFQVRAAWHHAQKGPHILRACRSIAMFFINGARTHALLAGLHHARYLRVLDHPRLSSYDVGVTEQSQARRARGS